MNLKTSTARGSRSYRLNAARAYTSPDFILRNQSFRQTIPYFIIMTFQDIITGSIHHDVQIINHFLRKVKCGNTAAAGHQFLLTQILKVSDLVIHSGIFIIPGLKIIKLWQQAIVPEFFKPWGQGVGMILLVFSCWWFSR